MQSINAEFLIPVSHRYQLKLMKIHKHIITDKPQFIGWYYYSASIEDSTGKMLDGYPKIWDCEWVR